MHVRNGLVGAGAVVLKHIVFGDAGDGDHGAADARQHAPQTIQVDAEPLPATGRLEVRVLPRQLRLLVPRAAVARLYSDPRS